MEKYKICPACGKHNPTGLMECADCDTDLTGVPVTDDVQEAAKAEIAKAEATKAEAAKAEAAKAAEATESSEVEAARPQPKMARVCACGEKNLPNARKCKACGEDISMILPQMVCADLPVYVLESLDNLIAHTFNGTEEIWGREHVLSDYLQNHRYVSREQCRLFVREGQLFVENKSHTNPTFVNNEAVSEPRALKNEDILSLGAITKNGEMDSQGAYFMVRIKTCM